MRRLLLIPLAVTGLVVGGWAYADPAGWYATFPGFGRTWLPPLGAYSEHLAKDTGALFLALAVVTLVALRRADDPATVVPVAAAWSVFNALHLAYHVPHLPMYEPLDLWLNAIGLSGLLACSLLLLVIAWRDGRRRRTDEVSGSPATGSSPAVAAPRGARRAG